jgi:hypothetical protein
MALPYFLIAPQQKELFNDARAMKGTERKRMEAGNLSSCAL